MSRSAKTKPRQPATLLPPGPAPSVARSREPAALWLPEPCEKWVQPEMPGKREDGKLWFEGEPKRKAQVIENTYGGLDHLPRMSDGPRDVRKGDRWLLWHE